MVALLFVVFDIETIFIFPWALIYRDVAEYDLFWALAPMLIFITVLFVGLIWAWSTGAIKWMASETLSETKVSP
jgi:NADH-quinone oxidoreductase subunit A